ncbi:hypothetical protein PMAYCL1PPCAC_32645, partial [Pristionchus mayeri]
MQIVYTAGPGGAPTVQSEVNGTIASDEAQWWGAVMCFHDPKTHDWELYAELMRLSHIIILPITIAGLIVNLLALVFLYRPPRITSGVFVYLQALLYLDIAQLTVQASAVLIPSVCDYHHSPEHTFFTPCMWERRFWERITPRLQMTINTLHVWTIAALSAHRYWKISRPVVARLKDTVCRARWMLIGMSIVLLAFRVPIFAVELKIKWLPKFRIVNEPWATERLSTYRLMYHSILDPLISHIIPFMWMSVFSLLTLYEIFRSRRFNYKSIALKGNSTISMSGRLLRFSSRQPLTNGFKQKKQPQELRATISIVIIIVMYMALHSMQLFTIARKWQLLLQHQCPTRRDYLHSHLSIMLSLGSTTVNAFVFIAFTSRLRKYFKKLIRKTSRTLSNSSEPPLSPKTTVTIEAVNERFNELL